VSSSHPKEGKILVDLTNGFKSKKLTDAASFSWKGGKKNMFKLSGGSMGGGDSTNLSTDRSGFSDSSCESGADYTAKINCFLP
jgi:hypothetical protein